jgi:DNA ligase-1
MTAEAPPTSSSPFSLFSETAEGIAATTKRNTKAAILGSYLGSLSDQDLLTATRFFAGHLFPLWDQRTTNVGWAALLSAIGSVTGLNRDELTARLVPLGDLGDLAFQVFTISNRTLERDAPLSLRDVSVAFEGMAAASGSKIRTGMLTSLLGLAGPLEARYLVKLLSGDLRVGLKEGSVEDAIAKLSGADVAEVQWANMLTGDIGETALLARYRRLNDARMHLFHPIKFMLATPAADLDDVSRQMPGEFIVEDKYDGIRAQARVAPASQAGETTHGIVHQGIRVALFSRTLDEITKSFPDLVAPLAALLPPATLPDEGVVLDGEIIPLKNDRILPFLELQKRLGRKTPSGNLLQEVPAAYFAFDALYVRSGVLINRPLDERLAILDSLIPTDGRVLRAASRRFSDVSELDDEFAAARARNNEGLMVKSPASSYKPGRRGRDWLKIKRAMATLDVVVTAVEVGNGRRSHLLSDYTFAVRASDSDPALLNVGKAYSGLTDAELAEMSEWFKAHTVKEFAQGKVRVVEPLIVLEVTFDLVQRSKRHKSGYALRFPRIVRLRPDKPAAEIDTLETVRRLAGE